MVNLRKARARQVLRPLWKWCRVASRHGLVLSRRDFTSFDDGLCVDGMPVAEWILAVCGCEEDGGTIDRHSDGDQPGVGEWDEYPQRLNYVYNC